MIIYYNVATKEAIGYSLYNELPAGGPADLPAGEAYVEEANNPQYIDYLKYVTVDDTDLTNKIVSYPDNVEDIILARELADYKGEQVPVIDQWVVDKFDEGVEYLFKGVTPDIVQTRNPNDLVAIQGLVSRVSYQESIGNTEFTRPFRAESNAIYELTIAEVYDLSDHVNKSVEDNRFASWTAKDGVAAAESIAEVDAAMSVLFS